MKPFQQYLKDRGLEVKIFPENTATAAEAAAAIGCDVAQIAKSLIFKKKTGEPVLVICSGKNRVNTEKLGLEKADADFCLEHTGFTIGGIPPFGHKEKIETLIDEDLKNYDPIWAAAGTIRSVFKINFQELLEKSRAKIMAIAESTT